jgi:hypothetical protein
VNLEGTIVGGRVELDSPVEWPEGTRVRVEPTAVIDVSRPNGSDLKYRFRELVRQWKEATEFTSSITELATHPAYQQIIGLGGDTLPLIFDELRHDPDNWFWALKAITGEDPVPRSARGNLRVMTQAWLDWAKDHGY